MDMTLVIQSKSGQRKTIPIKPGIHIVGRRMDCDLRIPHILVSRKHCRIINEDDQVRVQDLGSANGTFVNNERIMESVVQAGDKLAVGGFKFFVQFGGKPEHIEPESEEGSEQRSSVGQDESSHLAADETRPLHPKGEQADQQEEDDLFGGGDDLSNLEPLAGDFDLDDSFPNS